MSSAKAHYDRLLGEIYSWSLGDEERFESGARDELDAIGLKQGNGCCVVDLGCGSGVHAAILAQRGYDVVAIDQNSILLQAAMRRTKGLNVAVHLEDFLAFEKLIQAPVRAVLCMGDTITHLESEQHVGRLIETVSTVLAPGGLWCATFRDYCASLPQGDARFIPVRVTDTRAHTCFLEDHGDTVRVHDLVHDHGDTSWNFRVSHYDKIKLDPGRMIAMCEQQGLRAERQPSARGMVRVVATRV